MNKCCKSYLKIGVAVQVVDRWGLRRLGSGLEHRQADLVMRRRHASCNSTVGTGCGHSY
jgi:hypothetical protein